MGLRFTVLASGSAGNASLVEADGFGVLIDAGLGPRQLGSRLASAGATWSDIQAVLLTHIHTDHWKDRTFAHLLRRGISLFCHSEHHGSLGELSPAFAGLHSAGLVRPFAADVPFDLAPGLRCRPLAVRHDGGATFGFRLEGAPDLFGRMASLAYVADLGCWDDALADALADVDLLAVEFNHDVELEYASGRMPRLIARVVGDEGHLSNAQAAELVRAVLARSPSSRLRYLVQLHLSRECNRPTLARSAARAALADYKDVIVHTADQDCPGQTLALGAAVTRRQRPRQTRQKRSTSGELTQLSFPGFGSGAADTAE
jgi:ribonuclease BN (tRNA processing enzyme)